MHSYTPEILKITIHVYCFIPQKNGNLMIPVINGVIYFSPIKWTEVLWKKLGKHAFTNMNNKDRNKQI